MYVRASTLHRYDYVVVGSTWTEQRLNQLLAAHNNHVAGREGREEKEEGLVATEVVRAMQGVDARVWPWRGGHPPLEVLFQKHFVVFSGGKLEYRKVILGCPQPVSSHGVILVC
jgi:hypothetical protein